MARRQTEILLSRFGALVAQLESIVASAVQQPPDPLLCFDLLSELVSTVEEEPRESILQWQRKCEDALHALIVLGARRPIRRLASAAMVRCIARGDEISVYSRVSSLQGWFADGKRSEPAACAGIAHCLGEVYHLFGRRITSGLLEMIHLSAKLMKFYEDFVRKDALEMLEKALDGSGGNGASTSYSEAFRLITRVGVSDKSFVVRLAAARCLKTFASIGGPGLGITELEGAIGCCVKALEDPNSSVRDGFSEALGVLLSLVMFPEAQVKQKVKGHPVSVKKLEDALQKHLILPFSKASGVRMKELRIGLALSFVFYLQVLRLKYCIPDIELQSFALQCKDMLRGNADEDAHALACILYILRVGVADQMTEPTQRSFLVLLARQLDCADYRPSMGVAVLRTLSYLLATLGEVPGEFKEVLDNTVVAALSHSSLHVRIEAALTLRALAEVDPTCVGGLISYGVTTLHALRESTAFEKGNQLNFDLDSLHGQATVLASLVSISPKLLLGYPSRLPESIFKVSKEMLTEFSRHTVAATVEKEAGWFLLASLLASLPKEVLEVQVFDVLLLWAGPFVGNPEFHLWRTQDWASEIRVLSTAIETLTAFIRSFVLQKTGAVNGGVLLQPVLAYLNGALSYIPILAAKHVQNMKPALDLFTIRTLMAYQSLPNPMVYRNEHPQILQICTTPFSEPAHCEESSCLRFILDKRDACLGPWVPGRDWFEDELRSFDGNKDGIMPCAWDDKLSTFPQPESLSKMLINQMLLCFGTMFACQDNGGKLALLNMIDSCLKVGKKQSWHAVNITNACVGLLCGLKAVLASGPQTFDVDVLSSMQLIFQGILTEGEICQSQRRASAEGLGLLARLGNDNFTAKMTRTLLGELGTATDPSYTASTAFSLGCIHRSAGGIALATLVPSTVASISSLARNSNAGPQLWYLHALLLTIESAGLSYISQVQGTLFLGIDILLSEDSGIVDIRQEIGRLVNAIVAVLGPELAPGSAFFSRCKSVVAEISSCQETSGLLESVRFTQQLVLFAPQAVSVHSHVKSLLPTLSSRQPSLRYLAVSTLGHLIEKDPVAMVAEKIEENLFRMLDEETDTEIANLIRATITRFLHISCPSCPSRWLAILHNMVLATSSRNSKEVDYNSEKENFNGTPQRESRTYYGEDYEDMISSSGEEHMQGSASVSTLDTRRHKHLRYRTRLFAAECLSCIPEAVGEDPVHFDLSLARKRLFKEHYGSNDRLVLHLQELLSLSYQVSTGQVEGMQPIGVRLLCIIMDKFSMIQDPDLHGHLLLEQYQAQLVSAVRTAISMSTNPLLFEAGLQLSMKVLTSRILGGDSVAISRLFSLLTRPLDDIKNLYYPSCAEWIACKIKARLLAAHASIKCFVYSLLRQPGGVPPDYMPLIPLFAKNSGILGKYWIGLLKDYTCICLGLHSSVNHKPFLDGIQSSLVSSRVKGCLDEAWQLILQALALDSVPFESKHEAGSKYDGLPGKMFLSGHSMVVLENRDFHFLWGLALLLLFQGKQEKGQLAKRMLFIEDAKYCEDVGHRENYLAPFQVALLVFHCLSKEAFFDQKFFTVDMCNEIFQVLLYADLLENAFGEIICILSQIVGFCPESFFEMDDFTSAASELYFKCFLFALTSGSIVLQDYNDSDGLLSRLSSAAKTMIIRGNHKNRWRFVLTLVSSCYKFCSGASSDLCISNASAFLWYIVPFMREWLRDKVVHGIDEQTHFSVILETWASILAFLVKDCINVIQDVHSKSSNSLKVVTKMFVSCLEEVLALAELLHETPHFAKSEGNMLFLSVVKICVYCFKDTYSCINVQVQTVGLHVLKGVVQRQLSGNMSADEHSFILFLAGELMGDVFLIIQNLWKEPVSRTILAVTEECLGILFLFHKLAQASTFQQFFTRLLLEAIVMVFSLSGNSHSQELLEVKMIARKLVIHLVQIPSSANQVKNAMILMPVAYRQQLQDMIRSSVSQGQTPSEENVVIMHTKPIIPPSVNMATRAEVNTVVTAPHLPEAEATSQDKEIDDDDDDDDDDWNAFQSLPAETSSASHSYSDKEIYRDSSHPEGEPFETMRDVGVQDSCTNEMASSEGELTKPSGGCAADQEKEVNDWENDSDKILLGKGLCSDESTSEIRELEHGHGDQELYSPSAAVNNAQELVVDDLDSSDLPFVPNNLSDNEHVEVPLEDATARQGVEDDSSQRHPDGAASSMPLESDCRPLHQECVGQDLEYIYDASAGEIGSPGPASVDRDVDPAEERREETSLAVVATQQGIQGDELQEHIGGATASLSSDGHIPPHHKDGVESKCKDGGASHMSSENGEET